MTFPPKPNSALVIVGHGSTLNAHSSTPAFLHAEEIRKRGLFGEVVSTFWKEEPSMREVFHMLEADEVYVVPDFISEGYFTKEIIPRELRLEDNQRSSTVFGKQVRYCDPVGIHPAMTGLLEKRAREVAPEAPPSETTVIIVGHGTGMNGNSAKAIQAQVERLKDSDLGFSDVIEAYMEEPPFITDWQKLTSTPNVIVLPFFVADGLHSYQDIPEMLGMASRPAPGPEGPSIEKIVPAVIDGRRLYLSYAIGSDPKMADIILDQVKAFDADFEDSSALQKPQPRITKALERFYQGGFRRLGEIAIGGGPEAFYLHHFQDDPDDGNLHCYDGARHAREISRFDDQGNYRPLCTAPGLKRGWKLIAEGLGGLRRALDGFYPAAIGSLLAWQEKVSEPVPLRSTLSRQTGMYEIAKTVSDEAVHQVISSRCQTGGSLGGCVRKMLWSIDQDNPPAEEESIDTAADELPVICLEACNHLVSATRKACL